jgi:hypothetical protein
MFVCSIPFLPFEPLTSLLFVGSIPFLPFEPLTSPFALRRHLTTLGRAEEVGYERQRSRHVTRRIAREREGNARDWIPFLRSGHHSILGNPSSSGEQATWPPHRRARAGVNQAHGRAPSPCPTPALMLGPILATRPSSSFLASPEAPTAAATPSSASSSCAFPCHGQIIANVSRSSHHKGSRQIIATVSRSSHHKGWVGPSIHSLTQFVGRQRGPGRDRCHHFQVQSISNKRCFIILLQYPSNIHRPVYLSVFPIINSSLHHAVMQDTCYYIPQATGEWKPK